MIDKKQDFIIFLKYYFSIDFKEIKKTLTKPSLYSNTLFFLTILYFVIKIIFSLVQGIKPSTSIIESIVICLIIIAALLFQMYSTYKSGIYRHWHQKMIEKEAQINQVQNMADIPKLEDKDITEVPNNQLN